MTSTAYDRLVLRSGQAKRSFGLAIEGVREMFVSDARRSFRGPLAWTLQERVSYDGLDDSSITIDEQADWPKAQLKNGGVTLTILDTKPDNAATRVFGGRPPTRRTFGDEALDSSETGFTVVSTAGWATAGDLYVGRETMRYTTSSTTVFTVVRGCYGSLAHAHANEVQGDLEVTDVPTAIKRRRAQLYLFVDDENDSPAGTVIWRGIIRSISQTDDGAGWTVTLGHISELLEQKMGTTTQPIRMRGFYFPTLKPLQFSVREYDGPDAGDARARFCRVSVTGYHGTLDDLLVSINEQLDPTSSTWTNTSGTPTAPVNDNYVMTLGRGGTCLTLQFRTDGATPRWVDVWTYPFQHLPGFPSGAGNVITPAGVGEGYVAADSLISIDLVPSVRDEVLPDAFCILAPATYSEAPEDGTGNTPDRIYYTAEYDIPTLAAITVEGGVVATTRGGSGISAGLDRLRVLEQTSTYLRVGFEGSIARVVTCPLASVPGSPVLITPILAFGVRRWDAMLKMLADQTATDGPTGEQPWLPTTEFDWTGIEREVLAAGGGDAAKEWRFYKVADLQEIVAPELLALGLCWTTTAEGKLTVRRIAVATPGSHAAIHIDETARATAGASSTAAPSTNATPTVTDSPDGIVNDVKIRGGWDPKEERYTTSESGARMRSSWQSYGRQTLTIEPRGADMIATLAADADARARVAATLVSTYAYPYYVARFTGLSFRFATTLLGDIVAITDSRLCWRGQRGVERVRGQVVGRRIDYSAGVVDLDIRLSDWNAAAYAPSARIRSDGSGLSGSNLTIEYRGENAFSPVPLDGSTFYDGYYFQVGYVCRIREIDTTTKAEQTGLTIVSVDRSNKKVTFNTAVTADVNNTAKRFVLDFADYDSAIGDGLAWLRAVAVSQHNYAFIADSTHTLGAAYDPAHVWGP